MLGFLGNDILGFSDGDFVRALLGDRAEELKSVNFAQINEEYQKERQNYRDSDLSKDDEELEAMTEEEKKFQAYLDCEFPDYPRDCPEVFQKIGVENWWW